MRVIFLSQYFWPEEAATAEMLSGIAFALAERGLRVEALAGQPVYHERGELPRVMRKRKVIIRRVRSSLLNKNNPLGRILNTVTFSISSFLAQLSYGEEAILVAVTNPPTLPWVTALASYLKKTRFVLVVHDVYPDVAVALGKLRKGGLIQTLWTLFNKWTYRRAARIIVLGPHMKRIIQKHLPLEEWRKVAVVPNWAGGDAIKPLPREEHPLLRKWGMTGRFVVQYSGNIGLFHEIDTVLKAAELLERDGICFLFIGDGAQKRRIEQMAFDRWIENVAVCPFQPRENLSWTLTACDVALVTLKKGVEGLCVPSKFYGILAAGKPVIALMDENADVAIAVKEHGCGFVVQPGDARSLAGLIASLERDGELLVRLGRKARAAYEAHYNVKRITDQFLNVLTEVTRS